MPEFPKRSTRRLVVQALKRKMATDNASGTAKPSQATKRVTLSCHFQTIGNLSECEPTDRVEEND